MNTTGHGARDTDREELAALLPAPEDRDLRPGRHRHFKDMLMQEIDRDHAGARDLAQDRDLARDHSQDRDRSQGRARTGGTRWFLRPAVALPATALVLAGALGVGLGTAGTDNRPAARAEARPDPGASLLLNRIATVAAASDAPSVREDQFAYVRSVQTANDGAFGGPVRLGAPHEREVWTPQVSGPTREHGLIREHGQDWPIVEGLPDGADPADHPGRRAGVERPTYQWLASLPTDPEALLKRLESEVRSVDGQERAQTLFLAIGGLLQETVLPPETAAALYQAASRIPGVVETANAVDAANRKGLAVAREDTAAGERTEWIFDRSDLTFLGERSRLTRDSVRGRAGTVTHATAVLERAIVDRPGVSPSTDRQRTQNQR
ncbi:CU044_5270 family protein [Streptomyces sp. NPDC007325]|uniref:CU044_5270 family protein n=1 Tax=Streptomyces sp. NPDC007325 TaxID=3154588 RepID=UPI0033C30CC8